MSINTSVFAKKITGLRGTALVSDVSRQTGIAEGRLVELESGTIQPTGDEVLILSEFFRREFEYLISDSLDDPDENVVLLFRAEGSSLTTDDHAAIREFIFLCKTEAFLELSIGINKPNTIELFNFTPSGKFYKGQGQKCAVAFRQWLGMRPSEIVPDVYGKLRSVGFRVFRRVLPTNNISALFVSHPVAGPCILINLKEDINRQRFSAAHECGHAILDKGSVFNVTRDADLDFERSTEGPSGLSNHDLVEIRASAFATDFLIPSEYLSLERFQDQWTDPPHLVIRADELRVTVPALLKALYDRRIISSQTRTHLRSLGLQSKDKNDPELPITLNDRQFNRRLALLNRGLSTSYVNLCFEAYDRQLITRGKIADCLLTDEWELRQIADDFNRRLSHD